MALTKVRSRNNRRLSFECLEGRRMFAGNVTTQLVGGRNLQVVGDASGNEIAFYESGADFVIEGRNGTTVDGLGETTITKNTIDSIDMRMGLGNDVILVDQINKNVAGVMFTGNASFMGEGGNDTITLGRTGHNRFLGHQVRVDLGPDGGTATIDDTEVSAASGSLGGAALLVSANFGDNVINIGHTKANVVKGGVEIVTDGGKDAVSVEQLICNGDIQIYAGDGVNAVTLGLLKPSSATTVSATGRLDIQMGNQQDRVVLDAVHVVGNITIDTRASDFASTPDIVTIGDGTDPSVATGTTPDGNGTSTKGTLLIKSNDRNHVVSINCTTVAGSLLIDMGFPFGPAASNGSNLIVRNSSVGGNVEIGGGLTERRPSAGQRGNHIDIDALNVFGNMSIRSGDGSDVIDIQGSRITAGTLSIDAGAGGDTIKLDHSVARSVVLLAAAGEDNVEVTANLIDDFFLDLGNEADRCLVTGAPFRRRGFATGKGALGLGALFSKDTQFDTFEFQGITSA